MNSDKMRDTNQSEVNNHARLDEIRWKAKLIEENAEWKEQMLRVKGSNVDDASEINDMLIDAIEAKLQILSEI